VLDSRAMFRVGLIPQRPLEAKTERLNATYALP